MVISSGFLKCCTKGFIAEDAFDAQLLDVHEIHNQNNLGLIRLLIFSSKSVNPMYFHCWGPQEPPQGGLGDPTVKSPKLLCVI